MYGEGISKYGGLVDLAVKLNIIQKSGSWFSMGEERIGQGQGRGQAVPPGQPGALRPGGGGDPEERLPAPLQPGEGGRPGRRPGPQEVPPAPAPAPCAAPRAST